MTRAIVDRSKRYTSERDRIAAPVDRTADLAARAAFFTVADAMKMAIPLAELANRDALPAHRPLRVVDVGAGCGAMTLGLVATLDPAIALDVLAIDRDTAALGIANAAIRAYAASRGTHVTIATKTTDVTTFALPPCDLVVMGTVLNELDHDAARALVERALAAISGDGAVIIVEPALRDTARALHAVRDAILAAGRAHVFAPCTRAIAPCPMLAHPDDWCHEDRPLALPPRTAELARLTHLRDSGMKMSYLVLRRDARPLVEAPGAWRIVSAPRPAKGKLEIFGCSDHGRVALRLLKRNRTAGNREIENAERGNVVITNAVPDDNRVEIEDTSTVTRLDPSARRTS